MGRVEPAQRLLALVHLGYIYEWASDSSAQAVHEQSEAILLLLLLWWCGREAKPGRSRSAARVTRRKTRGERERGKQHWGSSPPDLRLRSGDWALDRLLLPAGNRRLLWVRHRCMHPALIYSSFVALSLSLLSPIDSIPSSWWAGPLRDRCHGCEGSLRLRARIAVRRARGRRRRCRSGACVLFLFLFLPLVRLVCDSMRSCS